MFGENRIGLGQPIQSNSIGSNAGVSNPSILPNWSWNFAALLAKPPNSTFTRASAGWYFNSAGVLTQALTNVPRFDYDPVTLQPLGFLSEMQSTNAVTYSVPDGTHWTKSHNGTGVDPVVTVNDSGNLAPDGTQTATKVVFNSGVGTTSADQSLLSSPAFSVVNGSTYGGSIFAKGSAGTQLVVRHVATAAYSLFTLTGRWDRLTDQETAGATAALTYDIGIRQAVNGTINSSATVWLWNAQIDTAGVGVTSPIPTAGSTVTRSQDILSLPLTSLPGWNASKGGVLVAAYRLHTIATGTNQPLLRIDNGGSSNFVMSYASQAGANRRLAIVKSTADGELDIIPTTPPAAVFTRTKQAFGWGVPRSVLAADGVAISSNTSATALPTGLTTLLIGAASAAGEALNGTLESIAYYAGARSDAFVQRASR